MSESPSKWRKLAQKLAHGVAQDRAALLALRDGYRAEAARHARMGILPEDADQQALNWLAIKVGHDVTWDGDVVSSDTGRTV